MNCMAWPIFMSLRPVLSGNVLRPFGVRSWQASFFQQQIRSMLVMPRRKLL